MLRRIRCCLALIASLTMVNGSRTTTQAQVSDQKSPRKITVTVEKERPRGEVSQIATGLTDSELATLRSLIENQIINLPLKHELVPGAYDQTHFFLSVVAEKFLAGGQTYFAVSSVLGIGKIQTTVGSLTHDVIVEPSLESAARAVVSHLSALDLRGLTVLTK
jgi:hypothetical protein